MISIDPPIAGAKRIILGSWDEPAGGFIDHARAIAGTATRLRRDSHDLLSAPIGAIQRAEKACALAASALAEGEGLAKKVDEADAAVERTAASMSGVKPSRDLSYSEVLNESKLIDRLHAMSPNERAKVVTLAQADPINHPAWAETLVRAPTELSGITAAERDAIRERLAAQRDPDGAARIAHAREQAALARRAAGALLGFAREAGANLNSAPTLVKLAAKAG